MRGLFQKYREVLAYLFFGVATTGVNIVIFFGCKDILGIDYKISNVLSWFFSVLFAYFMNKYFVFKSTREDSRSFFVEMFFFYWYRALSLLVEMAMMIVMIDGLHISDVWTKLITQVAVIVLNYFFSKFLVFKKNRTKD